MVDRSIIVRKTVVTLLKGEQVDEGIKSIVVEHLASTQRRDETLGSARLPSTKSSLARLGSSYFAEPRRPSWRDGVENLFTRASPVSTFAAMPVSHDPCAFDCKQYAANTSNSASSSSKDDVNVGDTSPMYSDDPEEVLHSLISPVNQPARSMKTPQCRTIPEKRRKSLVSTGECTSRKIRKLSASCFDTSRREQNGAQMGQALHLLSYALAGPKPKSKSKVWKDFSLVLSRYGLDGKKILFSTDSASNNLAALSEGDLASTRPITAAALVAGTARMVLYVKKSKLNSKIKDRGYNKWVIFLSGHRSLQMLKPVNEVKWNSLFDMLKSVIDAWDPLGSLLIEKGNGMELERCWKHLLNDEMEEEPMIQNATGILNHRLLCIIQEHINAWHYARSKIRQGFLDRVIARLTPDCILPALLHPKIRLERVEKLQIVKSSRESFDSNSKSSLRAYTFCQHVELRRSKPPSNLQRPPDITDLTADENKLEDSCVGDLFGGGKLPTSSENAVLDGQLHKRVEVEVKKYLMLRCHEDTYDGFWGKARTSFPLLSAAADCAQFFTLTTSSCERIFSRARDQLGMRRTELKPTTLEVEKRKMVDTEQEKEDLQRFRQNITSRFGPDVEPPTLVPPYRPLPKLSRSPFEHLPASEFLVSAASTDKSGVQQVEDLNTGKAVSIRTVSPILYRSALPGYPQEGESTFDVLEKDLDPSLYLMAQFGGLEDFDNVYEQDDRNRHGKKREERPICAYYKRGQCTRASSLEVPDALFAILMYVMLEA
ncbi:hypothetical protein FOL47_010891 [Perkinsus chesapeaki]|uniref:HAT C-terminal dimerisation domain-containing protein n=1 Tax=Perkinsus chesapeaki TaxID=330153 RepID=A0A7J6L1R1_PERCH|nr:hypothetical protein FOL47_010891 [Perkinsus chesapeaki]